MRRLGQGVDAVIWDDHDALAPPGDGDGGGGGQGPRAEDNHINGPVFCDGTRTLGGAPEGRQMRKGMAPVLWPWFGGSMLAGMRRRSEAISMRR